MFKKKNVDRVEVLTQASGAAVSVVKKCWSLYKMLMKQS